MACYVRRLSCSGKGVQKSRKQHLVLVWEGRCSGLCLVILGGQMASLGLWLTPPPPNPPIYPQGKGGGCDLSKKQTNANQR